MKRARWLFVIGVSYLVGTGYLMCYDWTHGYEKWVPFLLAGWALVAIQMIRMIWELSRP